MKTRAIVVALMLAGFTAAISQSEYDDVYFSRKDRMKTERVTVQSTKTLSVLDQTTSVYPSSTYTNVNRADSYSGRTINPDYQPGGISTVSVSYFTPNYQPMGVNSQLNQNPLYSANNLSPYYSYGNNFNGFNSFNRFGGGYSPFNSGWGYPSYGNNGFNSGFGCNSNYYGMNSYSVWGNSYYGNSFGYGMGYGYGGGFGGGFNNWLGFGNNYGYGGSTMVIVNTPDSHINKVYGKRHSRSTDYSNTMTNGPTGRGQSVGTGPSTVGGRGGRVATGGASTASTYYQRGWRQNPNINPTTSNTGSRSSSFSGGRSSGSGWMHNSGNSTFNNGWGGDSGSRSSSFGSGGSFGGGGGGRSSGGSTGGGGGSHHSGGGRGRN